MGNISVADRTGFDELSGKVFLPGSAEYDEARSIQNGLVDKKPAVIIQCSSDEDVAAAVNFAREQGIELSVKGGGHHVAGLSVAEDGVMIDLGGLNNIEINKEDMVARVGGGSKWGAVIKAAQVHGLTTASGTDEDVGVGGQTLGGGHGFMMSKYGLVVDSLVSARVVLADGRIVTANETEHPDLFWAIRGGGGNFGIVTEFTFTLFPMAPLIHGGFIMWPIAETREVLRFFREFTSKGLSDDACVWALLMHDPEGVPVITLGIYHFGTEEEAEREFAPIFNFGTPLHNLYESRPYLTLLQQLNDFTTKGFGNDVKSSFLSELTDQAIDAFAENFDPCPSPMTCVIIEHHHGLATRIPLESTAASNREVGYNFFVAGMWPIEDAPYDEANVAWARKLYSALEPSLNKRLWVNYLAPEEVGNEDIPRRAYGSNLERLIDVKTEYDPQNLFHLNLNIAPRQA